MTNTDLDWSHFDEPLSDAPPRIETRRTSTGVVIAECKDCGDHKEARSNRPVNRWVHRHLYECSALTESET